MSTKLEILNPNREVKLADGRTVVVREVKWTELKKLLDAIGSSVAKIGAGANVAKVELTLGTMLGIVQESEELVEMVLTTTTTLKPDEIGELTMSEIFGLLEHALELNVTTIAAGSKKAFGRIGNFVGNAAGTVTTPTIASQPPSIS